MIEHPTGLISLLDGATAVDTLTQMTDDTQRSLLVMAYMTAAPDPNLPRPIHHLLRAIIRAPARGIQTCVLFPSCTRAGWTDRNNKYVGDLLIAAGATVRYAPHETLMHAKMIMFDHTATAHLTSNLTDAAFNTNIEMNILIHSKMHAQRCTQAFAHHWNRASPTPQDTAP